VVFLETDEAQGFRITAEAVARLVTPRTKMILLNSPSNPAGAVMSPEDQAEVVKLAAERGIWVLSDECYVYLNYTGREFSIGSLRQYRDNIVIAGSLSKTYAMTGWRMATPLRRQRFRAPSERLQSQSTSNPTSIAQKAAVAALKDSQDCVKEMRADYIKLREPHGRRSARAAGSELQYARGCVLCISEYFVLFRTQRGELPGRSRKQAPA
jgi:aspartate aminotransferase